MNDNHWKIKELFLGFVAFALWLGTAVLGFYTAITLQEMVFRIYIACCVDNRWGFTVTRQWSTIILMLIWVSIIVSFGDYQSKHFNEPKSWKLFGWFYLGLLLALILAWLI